MSGCCWRRNPGHVWRALSKQLGCPVSASGWPGRADNHWLFAWRVWGDRSGWQPPRTRSWTLPCWHFMEWTMPSGFIPHTSPWVVRSVDHIRKARSCARDMAGNTLTFAVTAGATSGCPCLHSHYQSNWFQEWMKTRGTVWEREGMA